jgi:adenine-specific DNA-methyltransferase
MPTLQFKGKNIIWNHHLAVPYHTLDEVPELHYQPEKANGNMIIEGDNLIALKALLPQFAGKIKCIYIDPPYNTGNDSGQGKSWIYNDNVNSPLIKDWIGKEVGYDDLTKHDKWLCMMVPRLKLLRELLADDGFIFISIDDIERNHLKCMLDETFGEENFVTEFSWVRKKKGAFLSKKMRKMIEYILCYQKKENDLEFFGEKAYSDKWQPIVKRTNQVKELVFPANLIITTLDDGVYEKGKSSNSETGIEFLNDFEVKDGIVINELRTKAKFVWTQEFLNQEIKEGTKISLSKKFGFNVLRADQEDKFKAPSNLINKENNVGTNEDASAELAKLFEAEVGRIFPYPKPISLIKYLCSFYTKENDIILDSFAGSGTTMHAVMDLNKKDGGNRKCIMVQMTEATEAEPNKNICKDITRERVKRAIDKYGYDSGFKYYRLGIPLDAETMLSGQLPTYHQFAKYVYYLCTGENLEAEDKINEADYFVGEYGKQAIYLVYKQDYETLTHLALNLTLAEKIKEQQPGKRRIVYAPSCFLDEEYLTDNQIEYVGIPYNLFQRNQ